ncbi:HAD family hydrolase [Bacillus sp. FJAT-44742]|uniref:HAD family hydrolase n=1 Tax=Bacillus sp. FJAT-44742 TaxID=2014005 RepID=UPI0018E1E457|nr:HAD-IA family hydrolase [Bacillus sp. FJAT-44742]
MYKGVMFDMDNTLLSSTIDFKRMRKDCFQVVTKYHEEGSTLFSPDTAAPAEMIEWGKKQGNKTGNHAMVEEMLACVEECEKEGMKEAALEPGAKEILSYLLTKKYHVVVVTNNATASAEYALKRTGVDHLFKDIIGRDKMKALKPSSDSVMSVLKKNPAIPAKGWLMVGDSWIDGKAANGAEVPFILYKGQREEIREKGVKLLSHIQHLNELYKIC